MRTTLAVDQHGAPIEVTGETLGQAILGVATDEPEVMPSPSGFNAPGWIRP